MSVDPLVLDTEAFVAHYFDEPGADVVDDWLNRVYDSDFDGFVSTAALVELRYIICREISMDDAGEYVEQLIWPNFTTVEPAPRAVAEIKCRYPIALADAFALGTALSKDATLLVGADDEWEKPIGDGNDIERFRTEPA